MIPLEGGYYIQADPERGEWVSASVAEELERKLNDLQDVVQLAEGAPGKRQVMVCIRGAFTVLSGDGFVDIQFTT